MEEFPASQEFRETCEWLPLGRRHMVCRARFKTASGQPREGMSVFSYRASDGKYVHQAFSSSGAIETVVGTASADGRSWEFTLDGGTGDARVRKRIKVTPLDGGRFRFSEQTAKGDGDWSAEEVVTYRRVK